MRGIPYPEQTRTKAVTLRASGSSLAEIAALLSIPKNTLSGWLRHVQLTDAQREWIKEKERASAARGRPLAVVAWQKKIEAWKAGIRQRVEPLGLLPFGDPNIGRLACGLLYICEGGKYPTSRFLSFSNTDSRMIRVFLLLLRQHFPVDETKLRVRVMHRWDQDGEQLKQFWSDVTKIPLRQCYPAYIDQRTKDKPTRQANYRGVCCVSYLSTTLQYTLQAIGESVLGEGVLREAHSDVGVVGESRPPRYQANSFMPFPERDELWWLLDCSRDER